MHIEIDTLDSLKSYDGEIVIPISKTKDKIVSNISSLIEILKGTKLETIAPIVVFYITDGISKISNSDIVIRFKVGDSSPIIRLKGNKNG